MPQRRIVITDADPQYIADLVDLLKADAERQRCAIDALAQHHLFGDSDEEAR